MMEIKCLLLVHLMVRVIHGRSMHDKFERTNAKINHTILPLHHSKIDCSDALRLPYTLFYPYFGGYPWSGKNDLRKNHNVTDGLHDALDAINHVCDISDRIHIRIRDSGIQDYCLLSMGSPYAPGFLSFRFLCHHQPRDENLLHSLQCLHDHRLLTMLYFHIGSQYGTGILDRIMRGNKNAFWYSINVWPEVDEPIGFPMLCLPKDVISTCVRTIVESRCGNMTAVLVQDYILYLQHWAAQALESAGLDPDICHHDIDITPADAYMSSQYDTSPNTPPASSPYTELIRLAEKIGPGSALDSYAGKYILEYVKQLGDKYCYDVNSQQAVASMCLFSSEDSAGMARFNILQFAHQLIQLVDEFSCTRLAQFTACWNLLQETCGSRVRWVALHATLLVEGCKLQTLMDDIGCHWQDMLINHYIEASRRTVWPTETQALGNPMYLDKAYYSVSGVRKDLETVISLLKPGVEEIASRCGRQPAAQLDGLLHKIRYLQNDALKMVAKHNSAH